jgi:hypothetical protein
MMFDLKDGPMRAYTAFLGEFLPDETIPAPTWEDAPSWLRDAIAVAYFQGMVDTEKGEVKLSARSVSRKRWDILKEWRRDCRDYVVADDEPIIVRVPVILRGESFPSGEYRPRGGNPALDELPWC